MHFDAVHYNCTVVDYAFDSAEDSCKQVIDSLAMGCRKSSFDRFHCLLVLDSDTASFHQESQVYSQPFLLLRPRLI